MENQVVIKYVRQGEKRYIGDLQQGSYSGYRSKNPFTDPNIQKFSLEDALKHVKTSLVNSPFAIVQIIDSTGKVLYDNNDSRMVRKIVKEEVETFLNESAVVNDDNFKFQQVIKHPNVFFYNYDNFSTDHDADIVNSAITIDWSVGFWVNNYGLENFFIRIEKVEGAYMLELRDKQTDEVVQETQKNINEINWKLEAEDDVTLVTNGTLYIKDVSFDFKNQLCTVGFYKQK